MKVGRELVIDSSATLAWIYPDEVTDAIRDVFDRVTADGCFVPTLWRLEVANGLTHAIRRGRVTPAFRTEALNVLELLPISVDADTGRNAWTTTLHLADRFRLTVYDASYVELAVRRAVPLAALDAEMCDAARSLGLAVIGG